MASQKQNGKLLFIVLAGIVSVFICARVIAYLIIVQKILPRWLSVDTGGFRLHHFVYGNSIILITSFLAIALRAKVSKNILAGFYGIGLGLVLDEFPHWVGYVPELNSNVVFIPLGAGAVLSATAFILVLLVVRSRVAK